MTQHYVHQPQQKRGFPTWATILIVIASAFVLLCGAFMLLGVFASIASDDAAPRPTESVTKVEKRPTEAGQGVESPTPSSSDSTEEPISGPLDRLQDYWAAYGCEDFTCILDAGEPGMRPWWVLSIEEHSTYAAVRVDPEADPVWACQNVKGLLYPGDDFRVEVYDGTGTRQLAVYSAWSGKCVPR